MKRPFAAAAACVAFAILAQAARAGEIVLFNDIDYCGDRITVREDAYDLNGGGLNDRMSSAIVLSGVWQLCEHRDYGGRCIELGPGKYRTLPDFNDVVSSLREKKDGASGRQDHGAGTRAIGFGGEPLTDRDVAHAGTRR